MSARTYLGAFADIASESILGHVGITLPCRIDLFPLFDTSSTLSSYLIFKASRPFCRFLLSARIPLPRSVKRLILALGPCTRLRLFFRVLSLSHGCRLHIFVFMNRVFGLFRSMALSGQGVRGEELARGSRQWPVE